MTTTTDYTVTGMTCGHCVSSVTEEVSELDGVTDVSLELATGRLTVSSDEPIEAERVRTAVRDAGYQLADAD